MRTWRRCEATAVPGMLLGVLLGMMAEGAAAVFAGGSLLALWLWRQPPAEVRLLLQPG